MSTFRATYRLVLCAVWAVSVVLARKAVGLLRPVAPDWSGRTTAELFRSGSRIMAGLAGIRIAWQGPVPQQPYLLVCNHLSIFDIFVLGAILGGRFVARDDLERWPFFGWVVREFDPIFIDRASARDAVRVIREIRADLETGGGLIVFPEAGIAVEGDVRTFHAACFQPAVEMELPVHYAAIGYDTPPDGPMADEAIVWRDPDSVWAHFRKVAGLKWTRACVVFGEEPVAGTDRRALAESAHRAVWSAFQPLRAIQTRDEAVSES